MQTNPGKGTRGIGMSRKGWLAWQTALDGKNISTFELFLQELEKSENNGQTASREAIESNEHDIIAEPTARRAWNRRTLERNTWKKIFKKLALKRSEFFTDAEWHEWNLQTLWRDLLELAEDGDDRFGLVPQQKLQTSGFRDTVRRAFGNSVYPKQLIRGTSVLLEIPAGLKGYLILLEGDPSGNIVLISPSCLVASPKLTGDVKLLPEHPPSPLKFVALATLGEHWLWAGIFARLPDWEWLKNEPNDGLLDLQVEHLDELLDYASKHPEESRIWKSHYLVVDL
jgi:hypothetical protein